jgi:hypothetical protein
MSIDGEEGPIKRVTKLLEKVPATDEWDTVPHTDIDVGDENDPQLCCVYVNDIYIYLRENEVFIMLLLYSRIIAHFRHIHPLFVPFAPHTVLIDLFSGEVSSQGLHAIPKRHHAPHARNFSRLAY